MQTPEQRASVKKYHSSLKGKAAALKAQKRYTEKLRVKAFAAYGAKCACCGLEERWFLQFDHVENGVGNPAKRMPMAQFLQWLQRNNYPPSIQVLCFNCNWAKGMWGVCPHKYK